MGAYQRTNPPILIYVYVNNWTILADNIGKLMYWSNSIQIYKATVIRCGNSYKSF